MLTTLIAEDELPARKRLREMLLEIPWIRVVGEVADGVSTVQAIDRLQPDLLLLDLQMPRLDGLRVLERARHRPAVVFTTAYERYALTAFEIGAVDYLLKPFGRDRLIAALERVREQVGATGVPPALERARAALFARGRLERLFVRDGASVRPLRTETIERFVGHDDYTAVHVGGAEYLVRLRLSDLEAYLDPHVFVRIHRSHIVNFDAIASLTPRADSRFDVELHDGTRLTASRSRSRLLRDLVP